eukprot:3034255-Amphidinium_carterae.1
MKDIAVSVCPCASKLLISKLTILFANGRKVGHSSHEAYGDAGCIDKCSMHSTWTMRVGRESPTNESMGGVVVAKVVGHVIAEVSSHFS